MKYEEVLKRIKKNTGGACTALTFTETSDSVAQNIANWLVKLGIIEKPEPKLYYIKVTDESTGYLNLDGNDEAVSLQDKVQIDQYQTKFTLEEIKENPLLAPFIDKIVEVEE